MWRETSAHLLRLFGGDRGCVAQLFCHLLGFICLPAPLLVRLFRLERKQNRNHSIVITLLVDNRAEEREACVSVKKKKSQ